MTPKTITLALLLALACRPAPTVDAETTENFAQVTDVDEDDADSQPAENPLDADNPADQDDEASVPLDVSPIADLSLVKVQTATPEHIGDTATRLRRRSCL